MSKKGYFIANIEVKDPDTYAKYAEKVPPIVAQYGGSYLVRGGAQELAEGDGLRPRTVVLEFESLDAVKAWYHSAEYQAIIDLRLTASEGRAHFVEGH